MSTCMLCRVNCNPQFVLQCTCVPCSLNDLSSAFPLPTHSWAHQPPQHLVQQPYHTDFGAPYPASPSSSPNSGGETSIYPESVYPNVNSSAFPPPPSLVTGNPNSPSLISGHPNSGGTIIFPEFSHPHHHLVHPDVNSFSGPPPPLFIMENSNSRGTIIYPEFVDHLVHPDVDSFKDIPKLPGQTDPRGRY